MLLAALTLTLAPVEARAASTQPAFTSWEETFVDPSRPTPPGATAAAPDRTLVTAIYRPTGKGPFPLIVFAHGWNGHPDKFSQLLGAWAGAGYVVAAPAFPLTNSNVAEQNAGDVVNQPGDMSFVLTQMLRESRAPTSRLRRRDRPTPHRCRRALDGWRHHVRRRVRRLLPRPALHRCDGAERLSASHEREHRWEAPARRSRALAHRALRHRPRRPVQHRARRVRRGVATGVVREAVPRRRTRASGRTTPLRTTR